MGKISNFVIGAVLGTGVGVVINYLFGPSRDTQFNAQYRSRKNQTLEDGKQTADKLEAELRRQFLEAKNNRDSNL